jgi:hypothetical protein
MVAGGIYILLSRATFYPRTSNVFNFPESMISPEVPDRREDNRFEDWVTVALIENANQQRPLGKSRLDGKEEEIRLLL